MTPEILQEISAALYGPHWQAIDLANDLEVSDRSVRRWIAGSAPVPEGVVEDLHRLCMEQKDELESLIERAFGPSQAG